MHTAGGINLLPWARACPRPPLQNFAGMNFSGFFGSL